MTTEQLEIGDRAQTTAGMLEQIGCSTAAKVILEARYMNNPYGPTFISQLDTVLAGARPHPSGSRLERGDLIEVSGSSGSGKTSFLIFLMVTALLPSKIIIDYPNPTPIDLGGRSQYVALVHPTSHRSPILKIEKGLRRYLHNAIHSNMGAINFKPDLVRQVDAIVEEALGRLRIVKVKARYRSWALALRALQYSPRPHQASSATPARRDDFGDLGGSEENQGEGGLDLVVCDGFSDGFYHDRLADERRAGKKRVLGIRGAEDVGMGDVMDSINHLREQMGSVVVLSIQGLWNAPGPFFATHLPSPYPAPFSSDNPAAHKPNFTKVNVNLDINANPYPGPSGGLNVQITLQGPIRPLQHPADITLVEALYSQLRTPVRESRTYQAHVRVVGAEGDVGARGVGFRYEMGQTGIEVWHDT